MNKSTLLHAENRFMQQYPGGFNHPELVAIGKKHKMTPMIEFAQSNFKKADFNNAQSIVEQWVKIVSRSSMVSMFEKPKFRDMVKTASTKEIQGLADGFKAMLHGSQPEGFAQVTDILQAHGLAKWSLLTIAPAYYHPMSEVFVKPTTVKGVIEYFELEGLTYTPRPNWAFYDGYRKAILAMQAIVSPALTPNTAAFCGFLMMSFNSGER